MDGWLVRRRTSHTTKCPLTNLPSLLSANHAPLTLHIPPSALLKRKGRHVVYLQDLTLELNTVMFNCASRPGLGRILMALLDFSRCSIRCRSASEVHGGPDNLVGHFVGKTMGEAVMNTYWDDGCVLIGCADEYYNYFGFDTLDTKQKNKSKKSNQ